MMTGRMAQDDVQPADATAPEIKRIRLTDISLHTYDITIPLAKRIGLHADAFKAAARRKNRGASGGPAHASLPHLQVACWPAQQGEEEAAAASGRKTNRRSRVCPRYYVLTDSDTYRGAVRSGRVTYADCAVTVCESESDFLARHAVLNHLPTGYDPLRLGRMVRRLQEVASSGSDNSNTTSAGAHRAIEHIMQSCSGTIDQKFISLRLDDESVRIISGMCEWLGERLTRFDLPYYIPHAVSRVPAGVQSELAEQISLVVRSGIVSDAQFAWPAPEEIAVMSDTPQFRGESVGTAPYGTESAPGTEYDDYKQDAAGSGASAGSSNRTVPDGSGARRRQQHISDRNVTIAVPEASGKGGKPGPRAASWKNGAAAGKSPPPTKSALSGMRPKSPAASAAAANSMILPNTRNAIIIPGTDKHAPYVVDLRTRRVSVVDERPDVTVLREIGGQGTDSGVKRRPVYVMPHAATEWLLQTAADGAPSARTNRTKKSGAATGNAADKPPTVKMFMFDSPQDVETFARRQTKKTKGEKPWRGVIIYR